jgi:hypothetical protein
MSDIRGDGKREAGGGRRVAVQETAAGSPRDCAPGGSKHQPRGIPTIGQSVALAVEERDTVALFRGCGKVQPLNN